MTDSFNTLQEYIIQLLKTVSYLLFFQVVNTNTMLNITDGHVAACKIYSNQAYRNRLWAYILRTVRAHKWKWEHKQSDIVDV